MPATVSSVQAADSARDTKPGSVTEPCVPSACWGAVSRSAWQAGKARWYTALGPAWQLDSSTTLGRAARAALRTARNNNAKRTWRRVATTAFDDEMCQTDGRGGLTDAAGRSKVRSRDFVVVRSATRVDWLRRWQDAALVLPTRADTLRTESRRAARRVEAPTRYTKVPGAV